MKNISIVLLFSILSIYSFGQQVTQSIKGSVKDKWTQRSIESTNISLYANGELISGAATDAQGNFVITNVEVGRYKIIASFTGYSSYESELLVIAGKSISLTIELEETKQVLEEVVVVPHSVSASNTTTISIEKAMRVPANFFDPVRMLTSYPGVVTANDQSNAIVVKGYSPNALAWRLNGLDVLNPNHMANAGTFSDKPTANGGGVNVLSAQLLDRTDFKSGALPVQYGNALSGVMDMHLRSGNADKMQYTAQASLIGMDVAAEGPLDKEKRSSFLANYRYSTVGLLTQMGLDFGGERIGFQDFSFHLNLPSNEGGNLSVFGFAGYNENRFDRKPETEWETEKDRYDIDFTGMVYGAGVVNQFKPGWMAVSIGAAFSGQDQERKSQGAVVPYPNTYRESFLSEQKLLSGFVKGIHKISSGMVEAGVRVNYLDHTMDVVSINQLYINNVLPNFSGTVSGLLWQPYVSWLKNVGKYSFNAGVRYVNFTYNGSSSLEPRLNISRTWKNNIVSLAYGLTSQIQATQNYLSSGNSSLNFTKANQFSLEWKSNLPHDLNIVSSVYYHQLFDVPVYLYSEKYSAINQWDDYPMEQMVNAGNGRNFGIETYIEKRFYGNVYFLASGSVYKSQYKVDGTFLDARFNGNFTSSVTAGKEWKNSNKAFGIHARAIYTGGLRQALIDLNTSALSGTTVFDVYQGYSANFPDYFRSDLRISWRKNKPNYTRTLSIDIQNVTNYQNVANFYYDTYLKEARVRYQVGIIPILAYRVEF